MFAYFWQIVDKLHSYVADGDTVSNLNFLSLNNLPGACMRANQKKEEDNKIQTINSCHSSEQVVDFCCGANDFSCLMKLKMDEMGKSCNFKNYDIKQAKVNSISLCL